MIACMVCGERFKDIPDLRKHVDTKHTSESKLFVKTAEFKPTKLRKGNRHKKNTSDGNSEYERITREQNGLLRTAVPLQEWHHFPLKTLGSLGVLFAGELMDEMKDIITTYSVRSGGGITFSLKCGVICSKDSRAGELETFYIQTSPIQVMRSDTIDSRIDVAVKRLAAQYTNITSHEGSGYTVISVGCLKLQLGDVIYTKGGCDMEGKSFGKQTAGLKGVLLIHSSPHQKCLIEAFLAGKNYELERSVHRSKIKSSCLQCQADENPCSG